MKVQYVKARVAAPGWKSHPSLSLMEMRDCGSELSKSRELAVSIQELQSLIAVGFLLRMNVPHFMIVKSFHIFLLWTCVASSITIDDWRNQVIYLGMKN